MIVLLVEDEISKERSIINYLREIVKGIVIHISRSVTSAIIELRHYDFDYVLLDMSLPLFDNADLSYSDSNEFDAFGGTAILDEIDRRQLSSKVIVITAFDTLGEGADLISLSQVTIDLKQDYPDNFVGSIYYNASSLAWKYELSGFFTRGEMIKNEDTNS